MKALMILGMYLLGGYFAYAAMNDDSDSPGTRFLEFFCWPIPVTMATLLYISTAIMMAVDNLLLLLGYDWRE